MNRTNLLAGLKRLATADAAAPYSETGVRAALTAWLDELGIPFRLDAHGNTVARLRRGMSRRPVGLVAHMDHPGLRVQSTKGDKAHCRADGELPLRGLKGAKVIFPKTQSGALTGHICRTESGLVDGRERIVGAVVTATQRGAMPAEGDFAVLDLPAFARKGHRLRLRAADDLAGCAAIVASLAILKDREGDVDAWGIFTRAQEVGLQGAVAMAIDQILPRDLVIVSVECSLACGDIALGAGPVVRLGDRRGPFDPRACALVQGAANELQEQKLPHQRGVMDCATCEATAFGAFGYSAAGIAIPLDACHNQGSRGTIAPEEIDLRDLEGAAALAAATAARAATGTDDLDALRNELIVKSQDGRELLRMPLDPTTGSPASSIF